jgi:hypothetical protein
MAAAPHEHRRTVMTRARRPSGPSAEQGALALHYGFYLLLVAVACAIGAAVVSGWAGELVDTIRREVF